MREPAPLPPLPETAMARQAGRFRPWLALGLTEVAALLLRASAITLLLAPLVLVAALILG